jgi:hypothetical protein
MEVKFQSDIRKCGTWQAIFEVIKYKDMLINVHADWCTLIDTRNI